MKDNKVMTVTEYIIHIAARHIDFDDLINKMSSLFLSILLI